MTTRPFEDGFKVRSVFNLESGFIVKRSVVDDANCIAGGFIAKCEEMREVILAESGVIV
jgi:hypothetical protein